MTTTRGSLDVIILQHPQEADMLLGTAPLVRAALENSRCLVGLSWRSLADVQARAEMPQSAAGTWAVAYPHSLPKQTAVPQNTTNILVDPHGRPVRASKLRGLVVLDGSWSQAKALWWRNAWLLKLNRLCVYPTQPSIYGRLRKEPQAHCVSTLEAVADALTACGEPQETALDMRRAFRTMVQKIRDL